MLPKRFTLHRPGRIADAIELLSKFADDASPYAGGTELLIAMKARVRQPRGRMAEPAHTYGYTAEDLA